MSKTYDAPLGLDEATLVRNEENLDKSISVTFRRKGTDNHYVLVGISNRAATRPGWPITACYVDEHGNLWTRPWSEFVGKYEEVPTDG
jgi:hypothetical protein